MTSIVFFGTGPVAAASLDYIRGIFDIEAVVTKPRVEGFKGSTPVESLAKHNGFPLHFVANRTELDDIFHNVNFRSGVGIVVDFGIIISKDVIDSFEKGIINSHFSLLPKWRGADPISYTVLSGDSKAGVSLMVIDEGLDTGKLITYKSMPVAPKETTGSLTEKLVSLSNKLIETHLQRYLTGITMPKNQPHPDRATYSRKIKKSDGIIDWHEPAITIERKIRAFQPWPKARAILGTLECIILDADVVDSQSHGKNPGEMDISKRQLIIHCGSEALSIRSLQPVGKKEMPVSAFLAGYASQLRA